MVHLLPLCESVASVEGIHLLLNEVYRTVFSKVLRETSFNSLGCERSSKDN